MTSNRTIWDIEAFSDGSITEEGIVRLKKDIGEMLADVDKQRQEANGILRDLKRREQQAREELEQLKAGNKAYPKELEQARTILQNRLYQETGKSCLLYTSGRCFCWRMNLRGTWIRGTRRISCVFWRRSMSRGLRF